MSAGLRSVVTIGNFDGVHGGHLALVERAVSIAAKRGLPALAVTFDPHPAAVLNPGAEPPALQSIEDRVATLRAHGIADVRVIVFDERFAAQSAEQFVIDLLVDEFRAEVVVVGQNFRFGAGAQGDVATLSALGQVHGFSVESVALVREGDQPISSSALRRLLAAGDVSAVARGLGRCFMVTGEVVHGEERGRTIGVPTANVAVAPGRALPADGVYACWVWQGVPAFEYAADGLPVIGDRVPAVVNVGWRPTFEGTSRTVEAHLLLEGWEGEPGSWGGADDEQVAGGPDLYGRLLTVAFQARIRGEERFDGPEALVARIQTDIELARGLLASG